MLIMDKLSILGHLSQNLGKNIQNLYLIENNSFRTGKNHQQKKNIHSWETVVETSYFQKHLIFKKIIMYKVKPTCSQLTS